MCEFCETKKSLLSELNNKYCAIESFVTEIQGDEIVFSALIQEADRPPYHIMAKIKSNYCPKCGRELSEVSKDEIQDISVL